ISLHLQRQLRACRPVAIPSQPDERNIRSQLQTPQPPASSPIARPMCPRGGSRKCRGSASQEEFAETFQVAAARSHPRCLELGVPGRLTLQERNLLPACLERNEGGTF